MRAPPPHHLDHNAEPDRAGITCYEDHDTMPRTPLPARPPRGDKLPTLLNGVRESLLSLDGTNHSTTRAVIDAVMLAETTTGTPFASSTHATATVFHDAPDIVAQYAHRLRPGRQRGQLHARSTEETITRLARRAETFGQAA
ncbi:hypothetical protein [Saccharothrix syringae]|uniref:Uncharacterized protein n=1 Tax=Saccharothrix syringae TaxID=103733 RepID=A0A5Q0H2Q5_SACSY|nr:hypothetical protein [Saccharothrix syringae]QFZ20429.1 hypothetical protein EKG83_26110 [Saccharothrix syringae]